MGTGGFPPSTGERRKERRGGDRERQPALYSSTRRKGSDVEPEGRAGVSVCPASSWLWVWKQEDGPGCREPKAGTKVHLPIPLSRSIKEKDNKMSALFIHEMQQSRKKALQLIIVGRAQEKKSSRAFKFLACTSAVLCCCIATVSREIFGQKQSSLVFI